MRGGTHPPPRFSSLAPFTNPPIPPQNCLYHFLFLLKSCKKKINCPLFSRCHKIGARGWVSWRFADMSPKSRVIFYTFPCVRLNYANVSTVNRYLGLNVIKISTLEQMIKYYLFVTTILV